MYFLVDVFLLALLICVIWASVKFGFTGNFVFGIVRTVLAIACGLGASVGIFILMKHFGWISYMSDGVRHFFGEISTNLGTVLTDATYRFAAEIIAYIPFGLLFFVLGYVLSYFLVKWIFRTLLLPIFYSIKHVKAVKIIDNILGLCFNLAIYLGAVAVVFGAVHAFNDGDRYKDVAGGGENPTLAQKLVNDFCEPVLSYLHEDFSASVVGGLIYEYNPLNGVIKALIEK